MLNIEYRSVPDAKINNSEENYNRMSVLNYKKYKIPENIKCLYNNWFVIKATNLAKLFCKNIWWDEKEVLSLQSLSGSKSVEQHREQ